MELKNMPLCPSINASLRPLRNTGRLVHTKEFQIYNNIFNLYAIKNHRAISEIRAKLKAELGSDKLNGILLTRWFYFHEKRLMTKAGEIKQLDCENFMKISSDSIAKVIEIDDKYFIGHQVEKIAIPNTEKERIDCRFEIVKLKVIK